MIADTVEQIVNAAIFDAALPAAKAALRAEFPILNVPFISWLFDWAAKRLALSMAKTLSDNVSLELIALQTEAEQKAYQAALDTLKNAKTTDEINAAKAALADKLRNLVHFH